MHETVGRARFHNLRSSCDPRPDTISGHTIWNLEVFLASILTFYLASVVTLFLAFFSTFFLTHVLTFIDTGSRRGPLLHLELAIWFGSISAQIQNE